jgi:hypothetical protein
MSTYRNELAGAVWSTMLPAGSMVRQDEVLDNRIILSGETAQYLFSSVMQMRRIRMREARTFKCRFLVRSDVPSPGGAPIPDLANAFRWKSKHRVPTNPFREIAISTNHASVVHYLSKRSFPWVPSSHAHNFCISTLFHRLRPGSYRIL